MKAKQRFWIGLCSAVLATSTPLAYAATVGKDQLYDAVVIVVVKGVSTVGGNIQRAAQGTGFFVNSTGYLATSYHLVTELGDVDPTTITYEVHFSTNAAGSNPASPVYVNQAGDVMILYTPVGIQKVRALSPADNSGLVQGVTPIYTIGYPAGLQFTVDTGIIKSFGSTEPIPVWATNLSFKSGQSGSPVLREDNRVIGIVKAADKDAPSIGYIVPSLFIPTQFWQGSLGVSPGSLALSPTDGSSAPNELTVQAKIVPTSAQSVTRQKTIEIISDSPCAPSQKTVAFPATPGWTVETPSVVVTIASLTGISAQVVPVDVGPAGFRLAAQMHPTADCLRLFGSTVVSPSAPGRMTILVSYRERPDGVTEQTVTLASVSTNGKILTPIPAGIESNAVHVSVTDAAGVTKTIATNEKDFIKLGSSRWLDNAAVVQRAREML